MKGLMEKIKEVIVVEGKDDTKQIAKAVNADTFETNGSALSSKDLRQLAKLQAARGLIVFTDPDFNGERLRKIISQAVPGVKHAFIRRDQGVPDEAHGSLGVEHADPAVIKEALAHVYTQETAPAMVITTAMMRQADLTGGRNARARRERLGQLLGIGYGNAKQMQKRLAQAAGQVVALEIDTDLLPVLDEVLSPYDNVKVLNQDVLKADLPALIQEQFADPSRPIKVVANLPYYITSPILMGLLESPVAWSAICVMMQKEVAQRLTAQPGTKEYGSLTLAIEYRMQARIAFGVSRHAFVPAPNVDSAIVVLTPRTQPLAAKPYDEGKFFGFVKNCFAHRRKSLWNNLKPLAGKNADKQVVIQNVLAELSISPQIRPEKLTLEQFITLANQLHAQKLL